jgi:hypothetical protein
VRFVLLIASAVAALVCVSAAFADDGSIVSVTPSVSHAKVGQTVTFTVVEKYVGTTDGEVDINGFLTSPNLSPSGVDCLVVSNDGWFCEYGLVPAGTETALYTFTVLGAPRVATFTPCAVAVTFVDTDPSNDCMTGSVRVIGGTR